ncbi:MAG: (2Fe-2S)-binding protein [Candidatus Tectomicrobia bacterium]|uniref:(2Fe-2S)-binding protein n=1 Tax=Tectimicrobiota bacterium TaxID=2528274 RepID=A0A932GNM7_UNCTE|nr:(2Fe-2S)-binding protein [Candidatus Tectomicrobia bacterium]
MKLVFQQGNAMPVIDYFGEKKVETDVRTSILETSLRAGIAHTHVCGGNARCSTCRVFILQGLENCAPRNEKEKTLADRRHFDPYIRLACQEAYEQVRDLVQVGKKMSVAIRGKEGRQRLYEIVSLTKIGSETP